MAGYSAGKPPQRNCRTLYSVYGVIMVYMAYTDPQSWPHNPVCGSIYTSIFEHILLGTMVYMCVYSPATYRHILLGTCLRPERAKVTRTYPAVLEVLCIVGHFRNGKNPLDSLSSKITFSVFKVIIHPNIFFEWFQQQNTTICKLALTVNFLPGCFMFQTLGLARQNCGWLSSFLFVEQIILHLNVWLHCSLSVFVSPNPEFET